MNYNSYKFAMSVLGSAEGQTEPVAITALGVLAVFGAGRWVGRNMKRAKELRLAEDRQTAAAFKRDEIPQPTPTFAEAIDLRKIRDIVAATELAATTLPDSRVALDWTVEDSVLPTPEEPPKE